MLQGAQVFLEEYGLADLKKAPPPRLLPSVARMSSPALGNEGFLTQQPWQNVPFKADTVLDVASLSKVPCASIVCFRCGALLIPEGPSYPCRCQPPRLRL